MTATAEGRFPMCKCGAGWIVIGGLVFGIALALAIKPPELGGVVFLVVSVTAAIAAIKVHEGHQDST